MKVAVPEKKLAEVAPRVQAIVPGAQCLPVTGDTHLLGDPAGVEVWLRGFNESVDRALEQMPDLRWIQTPSAGVDNQITPRLVERGVVLTNAAGVYGRPIAETVLAFILAVVKHLPDHIRNQERAVWQTYAKDELPGLTLGVLGLGGIGREAARLAALLGMRVVGTSRQARPVEGVGRVYGPDGMAEVAAQSDFLLVAAPSTAQTRRMVDAALLARMKPTAWLINIARGDLVDEAALVEALEAGRIGGACLDVFDEEPLPSGSPLWRLPNVIITPHNSGNTRLASQRVLEVFYDNLGRYVSGRPLVNVVDYERGY